MKALAVAAFLLTLATWIFFYTQLSAAPPLGSTQTAVVFGSWLGIAFSAKWAWQTLAKWRGSRNKER